MARWLVELKGEAFDLEEFPYWFPTGEIFGVKDESGTYLAGPALDCLTEPAEVQDAAAAQLEELYSAIRLIAANIRKPALGVVFREHDDGTRNGYQLMSAAMVGRSKARATASVVGGSGVRSQHTQAQRLLLAARSDRRLRVAVSLLTVPGGSWAHLYRCLEELEFFLGRAVDAAGLCSDNERERFTRSANTAESAGLEARHRLGKFVPPVKPMSLPDAHSYLRQLLQAVLSEVANSMQLD